MPEESTREPSPTRGQDPKSYKYKNRGLPYGVFKYKLRMSIKVRGDLLARGSTWGGTN